MTKRTEVNSIVHRTLISDRTNSEIKDKAPAKYIARGEIFQSGQPESVLAPHSIGGNAIALMHKAAEDLTDADAAQVYEEFLRAREAAIVEEIRTACGVDQK